MPTDSYRPVQPDSGNQTSNLMSESLVGLMLPVTRQKATGTGGELKYNCGGGVNFPAANDSAPVMVVPGSFSSDRLAQVAAPAVPHTKNTEIDARINFILRLDMSLLHHCR
ncbi:MAG: hypothetical protein ABI145_15590 [Steroidobacteraceae bacterium]